MRRDVYDGLTGKEIREKLVRLVDEQLQLDGRLQDHIAYHNVELSGELVLRSRPAANEEEKFKVQAAVQGDSKMEVGKFELKTEEISFKEELPVPDLVRDELETAKLPSDAEVITRGEGRGV